MAVGPINIYEYEPLAKERLSKSKYDFIAGGATDEITLQRTRRILDAIVLRPKVMEDVSVIDTSTTVLGHNISFPVMPAPSGAHGRAHPDAELATVRAAGDAGTVMLLSSGSTFTMEEVAEAATGPVWFQQYFYTDRGMTVEVAHRAEEAGFSASASPLTSRPRPSGSETFAMNTCRHRRATTSGPATWCVTLRPRGTT